MTVLAVLGFALAIFMGVVLGTIGGGGSILTVPILVYFFGQSALAATTGSLFVVGFTALFGTVLNWRKGLIDFRTGIHFAIPSFLGVFLVRRILLPVLPERIEIFQLMSISKNALILGSFATLMILASRAMIRSGKKSASSTAAVPESPKQSFLAINLKGIIVGAITGFVGAGGGFLIVPALVILMQLPMKVAVATSLAIIAANALFGFVISPSLSTIDWPLLMAITVLGFVGLAIGSRFAGKVKDHHLKKGFGIFVVVVGSLILIDQIIEMNS